MILEELDDYLAALLPDLAVSLTGLPSEPPIRAVALIEQAGTAPIRLMAAPLPVADHNRVQVRNRAADYPDARSDAYAIYRVFEAVTDQSISGGHFYRISAAQAPFPTGRDERDRWLFSANYDIWRAPDAA